MFLLHDQTIKAICLLYQSKVMVKIEEIRFEYHTYGLVSANYKSCLILYDKVSIFESVILSDIHSF